MSWHRSLSGITKHLRFIAILLAVLAAVQCNTKSPTGPDEVDEPTELPEDPAAQEPDVDEPRVSGSVNGIVTVDNEGMPGVQMEAFVELFTDTEAEPQSTVTRGGGEYSFSDLESGIHRISILNPMFRALDCEGVSSGPVRFEFEGQVKTQNIKCQRKSVTFVGTLRFSGGDETHDPFVFSGGVGRDAKVIFRMGDSPDTLVIEGPGFAPSAMPLLRGRINASGRFTVRGTGVIAGIPGVSVVASGRLNPSDPFAQEDDLVIDEILVGGAGELPKKTSISYEFSGDPN